MNRLAETGCICLVRPWSIAAGMGLVAGMTLPAAAHQPILSDGTNGSPTTALEIEDIGLSQVVYAQLTDQMPQLWLTFNGQAGQELYVQLGLPMIDRLSDYRPSIAVLGPSLPPATLPFPVPAGMGAEVISTEAVTNPKVFHEPFSGTDSWILAERTISLPESGQYYIVAYSPDGRTDKLWVAVGKREEFGLADIGRLSGIIPEIRAFHEIPPGTSPPCFLFPAAALLTGAGLLRMARSRTLRNSTDRRR